MKRQLFIVFPILLLSLCFPKTYAETNVEVKSKQTRSFVTAKRTKKVQPKYPSKQARKGGEGWVTFSYVIGTDGKVKNIVRLNNSKEKDFIRPARRALEKWEFSPAIENGKPVEHCRRVQLDFVMDYKVRSEFQDLFNVAYDAIHKKDVAVLEENINSIDNLYGLINREEFWRNYLEIHLYGMQNKPSDKFRLIKKALSGLRFIDKKDQKSIEGYLLQEKLVYELSNALFRDAITSFNKLQKVMPELKKTFQPYIKQAKQVIKGDKPIYVSASFENNSSWFHHLARNSFEITELKGEIQKLQIRCDRKFHEFSFDKNSSWDIPKSWGDCSVYIKADKNTTFKLVELNT